MCPCKHIPTQIDTDDEAGDCDYEAERPVSVEGFKGLSDRLPLSFGEVGTQVWWAGKKYQNAVSEDEGYLQIECGAPAEVVTEKPSDGRSETIA